MIKCERGKFLDPRGHQDWTRIGSCNLFAYMVNMELRSEFLDKLVKGFFALLPTGKKCDTTSALWVGTASALEPMDTASL